jgi:hypothetical protein
LQILKLKPSPEHGETPFGENLKLEHPMCDCNAAARRSKKQINSSFLFLNH